MGQVLQKAKSDPDFNSKLNSDPVGTLRAAGVPDQAIADLLKENGSAAQVSGFDYDIPCWYTCWYYSSYCTYTIWWH
jgi:hypothetical protein